MRKYSYELKEGETRIISKFLFTPIQIGSEWRWFEFVKIKQVAKFNHSWGTEFGFNWKNESFVD